MPKILIIDSDPVVSGALAAGLTVAGFETLTAVDGAEGLRRAYQAEPDLIVLDIALPIVDGLLICRILRRDSDLPLIIVTARGTEAERLAGLEAGADDYVIRPVNLDELVLRIRNQLRRAGNPVQSAPRTHLQAEGLAVDLLARRVSLNGVEIRLAQKEFNLLAELMQHAGSILSRDWLLQRVWGPDYPGTHHTVDVHIRWLRQKLETEPSRPRRIATVRGFGYRLNVGGQLD